jgi:hypothetical protein
METRLFIGGAYVESTSSRRIADIEPATGGRYALEFWTEPKLVCVAYGAEPERKENRDG